MLQYRSCLRHLQKHTSGLNNSITGLISNPTKPKTFPYFEMNQTMKNTMKNMIQLTTALVLGIALFFISSCTKKAPAIDYDSMHVYQPEELQKLIDNAIKIERVGAPSVRKSDNGDSTVITTTVQMYRVYVATNDDRLVPIGEVTDSVKMMRPNGPIVITASCDMMCNPPADGGSCNVEGCMPTDKCGCTQGSCGNNCTTHKICKQGLAGFSFGGGVIMF